eukprot:1144113-Pelagomonas_calceolata.AAC.10
MKSKVRSMAFSTAAVGSIVTCGSMQGLVPEYTDLIPLAFFGHLTNKDTSHFLRHDVKVQVYAGQQLACIKERPNIGTEIHSEFPSTKASNEQPNQCGSGGLSAIRLGVHLALPFGAGLGQVLEPVLLATLQMPTSTFCSCLVGEFPLPT